MSISEELIAAYQQTIYRVLLDGASPDIDLRVGARSAAMDSLLAERGLECAAFISSCNPRSHALSVAENLMRMQQFEDRLQALGWSFLAALGVPDNDSWAAEASTLVLGMDAAAAGSLAREFEQNAFVLVTPKAPAELVLVQYK